VAIVVETAVAITVAVVVTASPMISGIKTVIDFLSRLLAFVVLFNFCCVALRSTPSLRLRFSISAFILLFVQNLLLAALAGF